MPSPPSASCLARAEAAAIVSAWLDDGSFPDRLLQTASPRHGLKMEIVYGAVKQKRALAWIARQCASGPIRPELMPDLMVGLYQVFFMDNIPAHALVSETVEAARQRHHPSATGFVNAVLRRALREKKELADRMLQAPPGVRLSHPDLLLERWSRRWPESAVESLCAWNNRRATVTVRPHAIGTSFEDWLKTMQAAGIEAVAHPFAPDMFATLPRGTDPALIPGFREGHAVVQDPSAAEAVDLLDPRPGERVLDACAAPGGKLALIAERCGGKARIEAADVHEDRLALLRDTLARLGLTDMPLHHIDASSPAALQARFGLESFDKILLDAPCSNTGVLQRRPDARWRFTARRLAGLTRLQHALLNACAPLLKPGGTLVYSSCSLEAEENQEMIDAWLAGNGSFRKTGSRALFPPDSLTDGGSAVALRRE